MVSDGRAWLCRQLQQGGSRKLLSSTGWFQGLKICAIVTWSLVFVCLYRERNVIDTISEIKSTPFGSKASEERLRKRINEVESTILALEELDSKKLAQAKRSFGQLQAAVAVVRSRRDWLREKVKAKPFLPTSNETKTNLAQQKKKPQ
eukprot:TRINITY_DN48483_c0_g1_i1.p1 TRINITY_DN48483_c0_g1~~TRINITY_DN48483_c0_g1_i1.p1  ORF type:complete len:148 (-),score=25.94 TRINITY_DN48483_c0_g1_i1:300-743(-)